MSSVTPGPGPASQAAQSAWLAEVSAQRTARRASVGFTTNVFDMGDAKS